MRLRLLLVAAAVALLTSSAALAEDLGYRHMTTSDGTKLDYRLLAPTEKADSYPVLLALPPGAQNVSMVEWGWRTYWRDAAEELGWVVVSPAAPGGRQFPREGLDYLPELLAEVARTYPPEGGKFHVGGVSNGGLSSFRIATKHPELFHSIAVLPGWPSTADLDQLDRVRGIPLRMWAGEGERPNWLELMRKAESQLKALGADVQLIVMPGEGHTIGRLAGGDEVFEFLESVRVRDSTP